MRAKPGRFVGIDLGTTFSAVAFVDAQGKPITIKNRDGQAVTPSVVMIQPDRRVIVGAKAKEASSERPDLVATNFKRDMGQRFYHREVCGKEYSPDALSALVLKRLKEDAEVQVGTLAGAVITIPAYFGDVQRKATQDAGRIASLNVVDIINEPTAAALANAFRQYLESGGSTIKLEIAGIAATAPSTTLVFDLGGGTFDVTIIRIDGQNFNVLATGGEVRLGGVDFDHRMAGSLADDFARHHGVDPRDDSTTAAKLELACEQAKIELTSAKQVAVHLEHMGRHLSVPMTRGRFEELTADLVTRMQISVEMLMEDALLTWDRIDDVLLVGGASRMPMVHRMMERISGKHPNMAIAPDQIVAHGAAIHATITQLTETAVTVTQDGARMITQDALTPFPEKPEEENILDIFRPEVVEAAKKVRLQDVNSHSLGVIVRAGDATRFVNSIVIPVNTPLPTSRSKVFGTEAQNQRLVRIWVVEGETRDPRGCTQIGECVIQDLPKGLPRGSPVDVTFEFDKSGRIHVQAEETTSHTRAEVFLQRGLGFDQVTLDELRNTVTNLPIE